MRPDPTPRRVARRLAARRRLERRRLERAGRVAATALAYGSGLAVTIAMMVTSWSPGITVERSVVPHRAYGEEVIAPAALPPVVRYGILS